MSSTQAPVNAPLQNLLLDNIRESVIGLNLNGRISYWSAGAVVLHGWTHEDTQDMLWREFGTSSEETIALADKMLERAYNTGSSQEVRHLRRKDGSFFYAETVVHFMRDKVGNSVGYAICDRDITPQRQLAEELRSVEECYRSIVEEQEELICRYNKDLVLTFVNRAYAEFWDKTSEDLVGTSLLELVPVSERDRMRRFYRSFTPENPNRRVEHPVLTSDGAILFQLWRDRAFFDESGELLFFQSVGRDITALRTAEAAMLDAGEREQRRIGQDIHDGLLQRLSGVLFMSVALKGKMETNYSSELPEVQRIIDQLGEAIREARGLARGLCPIGVETEGLVHAVEILAHDVEHMSKSYGAPIQCTFETNLNTGNDPVSFGKESDIQIYRIIQEAATNAVKHAATTHIQISMFTVDNEMTVRIADNGSGLHPTAVSQPGMGLRIMKNRVNLLGGKMQISPATPQGTVVLCKIPV